MSRIDRNTIHIEYTLYFLDYICSASFNTILFLKCVRMIGLYSSHVNNVRISLKNVKVDSLNKQIRLLTLCTDKRAFFDTIDCSDKYLFKYLLSKGQHQNLFVLQRESNAHGGRLVRFKLEITLNELEIFRVLFSEQLLVLVDVLLESFITLKIFIDICCRFCLIISVHDLITFLIVTSNIFVAFHDSIDIHDFISIIIVVFVLVMIVLLGACLICSQNCFFLNNFKLIIFILGTSGNFSSLSCFSND
mmetsp:Transcript_26390/g.18710  ORF Transcript_26390/g.18710 Transcript_26390/m.18710 type:complete len:248 (-) Transcript_26390:2118-2861(-)